MADDLAAESPAWWLEQLFVRLIARQAEIARLEAYYEGRTPLTNVSSKYRKAFHEMLRGISDNWMALVVDAAEERLHVEGFRVTDEIAADADAWRIWQENHLDADSELLHRDTLVTGYGYAMVWTAPGDNSAEITIEHPADVFIAHASGSRRHRRAAIKAWRDEWTGRTHANVYLPDGIHKFVAKRASAERDELVSATAWEPLSTADAFVENPFGVVPIIEFKNKPTTRGKARSEIVDVLSTQDQINKLVCDLMIASEFAAFPQRYAVGLELDEDPETGEKLEPFKSGIDRLFTSEDPDTKFGQFQAADLQNYVKAIENRVQSLASRTRTPPHYLLGQSGSFPSGESLKATETGLVAKVRSKQRHLGEPWEEVMRLAGTIADLPALADASSAETIWSDPESRTEAEHVDALGKLRQMLEVPKQQLWEDAGYSPQQIARFRQMLLEEGFERMLAGEPLAAPAPDAVA